MPLTRIKLTAFADGGITTAKLADNSITIDKLNNNLALGGNDTGGTPFTITLPQGVGGTNWNNAIITPSNVGSATIAANNGYYIDTTSGSVTINLPASPSRGDYVCFVDYAGTLSDTVSSGVHSNRIRLNPGTNKLKGEVAIKDIASPRGAVSVVYTDSALGASGTQGWVVMESANETTTKSLVTSAPTITSVLNSLNLGYFQDSTTAVMTITGTNFLSNTSVVLVPSDSSGDLTPTKTFVNSTSITFTVTTAIINKAKTGSFDDRFDIKVANPDGSYAIASDALEYAPAPTFSTATALNTSAQPITTNSNNPLRDTFAELNTASTVVATSLDADDVITYSLVSNDAGINGIAVASNGAISGTPSASPIVSGTYNLVVQASALSAETGQTKTTNKTFEVIMEAEVAAPTISAVGQSHISQTSTNITITGTNFFGTQGSSFNGTIEIIDPTNSSNTYPASTKTVTTATGNNATVLTFVTTQNMVDAIRTLGQSGTLDERFNVKVTNPAGAGSYEKTVTFDNAFEYKAAPAFQVAAGNVGTLQAAASQDYSTLTGLSSGKLHAVIRDPDDTGLQHSLVNVASELSGLTINQSTGAITGTVDLTSVASGTYNFGVQVQSTSAETNVVTQDTRTYSITVASTSSGPGYTSNIQNSLYFNGGNGGAYLSRTSNSSGSSTTLTFSAWIKRAALSSDYFLFSEAPSSHQNNPYITYSAFNSSDNINSYSYYSSAVKHNVVSSAVFRDTSSFYHVVYVYDIGNSDSAQRVKIYVNGSLLSTGTYTMTADATVFNTGNEQIIGNEGVRFRYGFPGYMANIHFVDGQALGPEYFGKTDTTTGTWIAKAYDGTTNETGTPSSSSDYDTLYGSNGFHLDFRASSLVYNGSTLTTVNDVSGRTTPNNWTAN